LGDGISRERRRGERKGRASMEKSDIDYRRRRRKNMAKEATRQRRQHQRQNMAGGEEAARLLSANAKEQRIGKMNNGVII